MQRFKVISPLDHDLVAYPIGAVIECDQAIAAQLEAAGVIVREMASEIPAPTSPVEVQQGDPAESAQEPASAQPVQPGSEDAAGTEAPAPAPSTPSEVAEAAAAPRRRAARARA